MPNQIFEGGRDGEKILGWDGTAVGTSEFGSAFVEVTTYNTAITVNCGAVAANPVQVINMATGVSSPTITATGLYAVPAIGSLSLSGNGGSVVNLMLKR